MPALSPSLLFHEMVVRQALRRLAPTNARFASKVVCPVRHMSCGIVGLPNVGKSTLFNALTNTQSAQAANYPFCTIEPNTATVAIPDKRLEALAKLAQTERLVLSQLEFTDVAGLVRGAHRGEGLGNQFLANIRECSVILHVLRCFEDPDIVHVDSRVDPVEDLKVIETELILADMEAVEKRLAKSKRKQAHTADSDAPLLEKCRKYLEEGVWLAAAEWTDKERESLDSLQLLTSKKMAYICNVDEASAATGNQFTEAVATFLAAERSQSQSGVDYLVLSASLEQEASSFDCPQARLEYLEMAGIQETGLDKVVVMCSELLGHHHYYTVGQRECRSWQIPRGATAQEAAGKIHSDIQKGFIKADVISPEVFLAEGGEANVRAKNLVRVEGKEYIVQDGDIMNFKFNNTR